MSARRPRDPRRAIRLVVGGLLLLVGVVSALSALLVGPGDSFSPLFTTPAFALAVIGATVTRSTRDVSAPSTLILIVAALAPAGVLTLWLSMGTAAPVIVVVAQAIGVIAAVVGAAILTRGSRGRGFLTTVMVLLALGLLLGVGANAWPSATLAVVGVVVASAAAVVLAVVQLGVTMQPESGSSSSPSAHPAASKVTGG